MTCRCKRNARLTPRQGRTKDATMTDTTTKPRLAEYGSLRKEDFGTKTTLAERQGQYGTMRVVHRAAGYQCAGSMARFDDEAWGAIFTDRYDGTTHGQWFKTEAEARARFAVVIAANADSYPTP